MKFQGVFSYTYSNISFQSLFLWSHCPKMMCIVSLAENEKVGPGIILANGSISYTWPGIVGY